MRIGLGYDVHKLVEGRKLILGGIEIPHDKGLLGHSDADVLAHALSDAIVGALRIGDIGKLFPDTDPAYKDADSMVLLGIVARHMSDAGFELVDADTVVMAENPKLAPYRESMRHTIASVLGVDISQIGIKATTTEKLGFVGREEGIAASAVVLLKRKDSTHV